MEISPGELSTAAFSFHGPLFFFAAEPGRSSQATERIKGNMTISSPPSSLFSFFFLAPGLMTLGLTPRGPRAFLSPTFLPRLGNKRLPTTPFFSPPLFFFSVVPPPPFLFTSFFVLPSSPVRTTIISQLRKNEMQQAQHTIWSPTPFFPSHSFPFGRKTSNGH